MKKIFYFLLGALFLLYGCKKANKLTQFDINYTTTVTIPSSTGINTPFNLTSPDIETNSDSKFQINSTRKDKVESISLKQLELAVKLPNTGNFDFLKSIEVYINADDIQEQKIAWKEDIPNGSGKNIRLDVSGTDLKPYILKEDFGLRIRTITDEVITSDYKLEVNSTFLVDAKIL